MQAGQKSQSEGAREKDTHGVLEERGHHPSPSQVPGWLVRGRRHACSRDHGTADGRLARRSGIGGKPDSNHSTPLKDHVLARPSKSGLIQTLVSTRKTSVRGNDNRLRTIYFSLALLYKTSRPLFRSSESSSVARSKTATTMESRNTRGTSSGHGYDYGMAPALLALIGPTPGPKKRRKRASQDGERTKR